MVAGDPCCMLLDGGVVAEHQSPRADNGDSGVILHHTGEIVSPEALQPQVPASGPSQTQSQGLGPGQAEAQPSSQEESQHGAQGPTFTIASSHR